MSAFKSKEFRVLQEEWSRKLKQDGFRDIEDLNSPLQLLNKYEGQYFAQNYSLDEYDTRREYFERAGDLLHTFQFSSKLEKAVWQSHADGLSLREIVRKLRTKENFLNKDKANGFIRRIKKDAWGHE